MMTFLFAEASDSEVTSGVSGLGAAGRIALEVWRLVFCGRPSVVRSTVWQQRWQQWQCPEWTRKDRIGRLSRRACWSRSTYTP